MTKKLTELELLAKVSCSLEKRIILDPPDGEACSFCDDLAAGVFMLYPCRERFPLCKYHLKEAYPPTFSVQINRANLKTRLPAKPAGDYHLWVGSLKFNSSTERGITLRRISYNPAEQHVEPVEFAAATNEVFVSINPTQALVLLDVLRESEELLAELANQDYQASIKHHDLMDEAARRADVGGWPPVEEY